MRTILCVAILALCCAASVVREAGAANVASAPGAVNSAISQNPKDLTAWTRWPAPTSPVLAARRTATPPVVDGKPDEAVWREAAWSSAFMDMVDGAAPWLRTEVALLWDETALYVAVRMEEPWLEASIAERDGQVYRDPDFELFIAGKDAYWEVEVNARNTVYDVFWIWRDALTAERAFDPARWDALTRRVMALAGIGAHRHPRGERVGFIDENMRGLQVAVSLSGTLNDNSDTDRGWTVELAIPWESLRDLGPDVVLPPVPGSVLSMNFSRFVSRDAQGRALPQLAPAGWALTRHGVFDSHVPERFARVLFTEGGLPGEGELRAFLAAHLSAADRVVLGEKAEDFVNKHAAFVAQVVAHAPWKESLTPELVRAYLLSPRVTGEPLEEWQDALRAELLPLLTASVVSAESAGLTGQEGQAGRAIPQMDLKQAMLHVRRWLATKAVPGLSPPWSLGPLTLMRAGAGRCEELGILLVDAARAVGIPARISYTPAWRSTEGNHLWVEFWDGEKWLALSPEQPDAAPCAGWFTPLLAKAAVVQSRGFGPAPAGTWGKNIISLRDGTFTLNTTADYTHTGTLRVRCAPGQENAAGDALGDALTPPADIRVYVFSAGRPRVVAAGHGADVSFELGTGSYLLSVARADVSALHSVIVRKGSITEQVVLPSATPATSATLAIQAAVQVNEAEGFAPFTAVTTAVAAPGPAQRPFPAAVDSPAGAIPFADSLYALPQSLRQERARAQAAWAAFWGPRAEDASLAALFVHYVLSGRVEEEPFSHWREPLAALLQGALVPRDANRTAQQVRQVLAERHPAGGSLSGLIPLAALVQTQTEGAAAESLPLPLPDRVWAGLCAAGLRSLGIPARVGTSGLRPGMGGGVWTEYFDGAEWRYLLREDAGYAAHEARRVYGAQGSFDPARWGLNLADVHRSWTLCRVGRGGELFAVPLDLAVEGAGAGAARVAVGDYVLVAGQRDAQPDTEGKASSDAESATPHDTAGFARWWAEPVQVR